MRVLVCAPSNSALDEIVLRLLSTGIYKIYGNITFLHVICCAFMRLFLMLGIRDENDRSFTPKIVRIGLKAHHSVQAVSMDYLVCIWELPIQFIHKLLI